MTSSLGELAKGTFVPMLRTLDQLLDKGAEKLGPEKVAQGKLAPDMYPLSKQVLLACHHALDATHRLTGREPPELEDVDEPLAALHARLRKTVEVVESTNAAAFDGERDIVMPLGPELVLEMKGARFLRDWSLPHFYFHVVTAYDILRNAGVQIGKRDYLAHIGDAIRPNASEATRSSP